MFQRLWVQIPAREMFEKAENKWKRKRGIFHYWRRKNIFKNVEIDWICYRLFPSKQEFIAQLRWPTTRSQSYKETSLQDWAQIWTAYLQRRRLLTTVPTMHWQLFFIFPKVHLILPMCWCVLLIAENGFKTTTQKCVTYIEKGSNSYIAFFYTKLSYFFRSLASSFLDDGPLKSTTLFISYVACDQCDQLARLFCSIWIYNNENRSNSIFFCRCRFFK